MHLDETVRLEPDSILSRPVLPQELGAAIDAYSRALMLSDRRPAGPLRRGHELEEARLPTQTQLLRYLPFHLLPS